MEDPKKTDPDADAETAAEPAPEPQTEAAAPEPAEPCDASDGSETEEERVARLITSLTDERDAFKDKWTRALAETENVRRRAERDKTDAQTYGGTRLARDLLSVHDNLERALKAADETLRADHASLFEGIELTQRELINAFAKHKIEKVTPEPGEKFDPNRHQAMFEAPIPGAEPGTVIETMQDGFVIADRLLRPALVGVAKAMPDAAATPEADSA